MIDAYFDQLEQVIHSFPNIQASVLKKKRYNAKKGFVSGALIFDSGNRLEFIEVKDVDQSSKSKYRYQYMDQQNACIFRYDSVPHHRDIATFPHHKHIGEEIIVESSEPDLFDVLLEIAQRERRAYEDSLLDDLNS